MTTPREPEYRSFLVRRDDPDVSIPVEAGTELQVEAGDMVYTAVEYPVAPVIGRGQTERAPEEVSAIVPVYDRPRRSRGTP